MLVSRTRSLSPSRPAVKNLVPYSYDLSSWTSKINVTPTLDTTGPDGLSATTIAESTDAGAEFHYLVHSVGTLAAEWYELAFVAKLLDAGRGLVRVEITSGGPCAGRWWSLSTGADGAAYAATWTAELPATPVENLGAGWYRYNVYVLPAAGAASLQILTDANAFTGYYQGDGRDCFAVSAVQLARGKYRHQLKRRNG